MKKIKRWYDAKMAIAFFVCGILVTACASDEETFPETPLQTDFEIPPVLSGEVHSITSPYEASGKATYLWSMIEAGNTIYSLTDLTSKSAKLLAMPGMYQLALTVKEEGKAPRNCTVNVEVKDNEKPATPYLYKVYDFLPAVGQFTNDIPLWKAGETKEDMIAKAEQYIAGKKPSMISLGGFGGYVVFGFDHTIVNVAGKRDVRILGNAFYADSNPNPDAGKGGSCEPGIILVAYDQNQNGKPDDDEWYEIAGSEYNNPKAIRNYEITYHRPSTEVPDEDADPSGTSIKQYIYWEDNQGNSGYKVKNSFHAQSYYPGWVTDDQITFKGTRLPNNGVDEGGNGSYWVLYSFAFGYADNVPNAEDESAIDIDWAVDATGKKVHLPGIDFVKVYNSENQECGWVGENSTEVAGAQDLHLLNSSIDTRNEHSVVRK